MEGSVSVFFSPACDESPGSGLRGEAAFGSTSTMLSRAISTAVLIVASCAWIPHTLKAEVLINEFLASNSPASGFPDADGHFEDWIEIHNASELPVNLAGYTLTDDPALADKWTFPTVAIAAGEYLIVWASEKNRPAPVQLHTNFKLERDGGYVALHGPDGEALDALQYDLQRRDTSFGRQPDASSRFAYFLEPTPNASNTTTAYDQVPSITPAFLPGGGFFLDSETVTLAAFPPRSVVHYTLDGSTPNNASTVFSDPIELTATTVVRAIAYLDGVPLSNVGSHTYFLGNPHSVPLVSISTTPEHLWSEDTGIFANPARTGVDWEREGSIEMFDVQGARVFGKGVGLRTHGGASRLNSEKHSLRLYFRDIYGGGRLRADLFASSDGVGGIAVPPRFDTLVLRAGYHDSWVHFNDLQRRNSIYVRDQLVRNLHLEMGQLNAHGEWVGLYINGRYNGLYNLTERVDEEFFDAYSTHDQWDVIKEGIAKQGDEIAWNQFVLFMTRSNMADPIVYEQAVELLDIASFVTYVIVNVWAANRDWPQRNWYAARTREDPAAKWIFVNWDAEQTFADNVDVVHASQDTLSSARAQNGEVAEILDNLLRNTQFRDDLLAGFEEHLGGILSAEQAIPRLDMLVDRVAQEIQLESARWDGETVARWNASIERVRQFIRDREPALLTIVRESLDTSDAAEFPRPVPLPLGTNIAFIVRDANNPSPANEVVRDRLLIRDATVNLITETRDSPTDVSRTHDLLLIASSIHPSNVAADYRNLPIPRVIWESGLLAPTWEPLSGGNRSADDQSLMRFLEGDHPITRGLPRGALQEVTTSNVSLGFGDGTVGPGVDLLATGANPGHYAILAAETGAEYAVPGHRAPARSVFISLGEDGFRRANGHLFRVFDQAVDWAIDFDVDDAVIDSPFLRGDVNADGDADISDVVSTIGYLFLGSLPTPCLKSMDTNDDGGVDIADAIFLLDYLFRAGLSPLPPFPEIGLDPTPDRLPCPEG